MIGGVSHTYYMIQKKDEMMKRISEWRGDDNYEENRDFVQ